MKPDVKKLVILNLPYLIFAYLFGKCGQAYRLAAGADLSGKLLHFADGFTAAFANPLPSLQLFDFCVGVAGALIVRMVVYCKGKNAKKYRKGVEYGSARWGTAKDIAPYIDPKFENNILLTQTERLTMTGRPKDPKTARNKNVLVIGGSGSGKTRFFVKPNLMQCFPTTDYPTSFVVTDPKGTLVLETGKMFQQAGYRIKILNTINFSKSMKYNPFVYIHSEKDVLKLVNTLIANTKGEGEKSAEDFWVKSERLFYTALIGYIWYEAPAEEMNFTTLLELINASEAREDDPEFQSPVDLMFERLEQKDPDHFAVRQYKKFLLSAGKTRSSILISCGARLAPFDIREVRELMEDDEMELDTIGDEKTVLFLIMSDTDTTFNFILAIDELCALPVEALAAKDCLLFLWATFPMLPEALQLIRAWGFTFKTVAFVWLKQNRKSPTWFYGLGYWTRGNAEICLLAKRGKPKRHSAAVHQFIISPIEQHSKKPDVTRDKIVKLAGDLPRVELFARQKCPGWDAWGNEVECDLTLNPS